MKVSELTPNILAGYLRIDDDCLDDLTLQFLETAITSAKGYIKSYTGLTDEEIDEYSDLTIACMTLVQDFYDTRSILIPANKSARNKTVDTILGMHSRNLL